MAGNIMAGISWSVYQSQYIRASISEPVYRGRYIMAGNIMVGILHMVGMSRPVYHGRFNMVEYSGTVTDLKSNDN